MRSSPSPPPCPGSYGPVIRLRGYFSYTIALNTAPQGKLRVFWNSSPFFDYIYKFPRKSNNFFTQSNSFRKHPNFCTFISNLTIKKGWITIQRKTGVKIWKSWIALHCNSRGRWRAQRHRATKNVKKLQNQMFESCRKAWFKVFYKKNPRNISVTHLILRFAIDQNKFEQTKN